MKSNLYQVLLYELLKLGVTGAVKTIVLFESFLCVCQGAKRNQDGDNLCIYGSW